MRGGLRTITATPQEPHDAAEARSPLAGPNWLCDPDTLRVYGGAGGVTAGGGLADGRPVEWWAQDARVAAGSLGTAGGAVVVAALERAEARRRPLIAFPNSAGASLREGSAALSAYARIFRAQACSSMLQLSVVAGVCAGGAAYGPALGDITILVRDEGRMFLTGPRVVEATTREIVTLEALGSALLHGRNGNVHAEHGDLRSAVGLIRRLLSYLPPAVGERPPGAEACQPLSDCDIGSVVPSDHRSAYDIRMVVRALVDDGDFVELAPRWARNFFTGIARIGGKAIGVLANQPAYLGGVIDAAAADKGTWFVRFCSRFELPMLVLVDTPGFLPGIRQEKAAVIRQGASLVRAFARADVPRVTVTLRHAYGGAHIVMNSRYLGASRTLVWPQTQIGVMGARQAVQILHRRELGDECNESAMIDRYTEQKLHAMAALRCRAVHEAITPDQTRGRLVELFA